MTVIRRVLLVLIGLVSAGWIQSYAAPGELPYRSAPRASTDGDLSPSQETWVVCIVSQRGHLMVLRFVEWRQLLTPVQRLSLGRPEYSAGTLNNTLFTRLGFDYFAGPDEKSDHAVIIPHWFLLLIPASAYAAILYFRRRKQRGFAVLTRAI